jgi:hypothetical protein
MATSLIIGLVAVALAMLIQRLMLRGAKKRIRNVELIFRFHKFRDQLQDLAVSGEIDPRSARYAILIGLCNFAIRNGGRTRFRDLIPLIESVNTPELTRLLQTEPRLEWESMPEQEREVVGGIFVEFIKVMVLNDLLLTVWFFIHSTAHTSGQRLLSILSQVLAKIIGGFSPTRGQVMSFVSTAYPAASEV